MRERDPICDEGLVSREGCVEKELDFTSTTDVASQRPGHFVLISRPRNFLSSFANSSIR